MARQPGASEPIAIAAETDRVYLGATGAVTIEDPGWRRRVVVGKSGSSTTVVWNPWVAKAKAMPDFGDEEWSGMVCVETANAMDDAVTLAPGRDARHDRDARGPAGLRLRRARSGATRSGHARAISS